ncbi:PIG-L deacetylase family protein [Lacrimispora brassicae]
MKNYYTLPKAERIMVFAPHMDDESVGCGGTLMRYRQIGCQLDIVYLTKQANDTSLERKSESLQAAEILAASSITFYDYPEETIQLTETLIDKIYQEVLFRDPDLIFAPHANDLHQDHIVTGLAVAEALRRKGTGLVAYYEIWNPIAKPNCFINITQLVHLKRRLINCYQSQIKKYPLAKLSFSLNSYRAALLQLKKFRFVEGFLLESVGGCEEIQ